MKATARTKQSSSSVRSFLLPSCHTQQASPHAPPRHTARTLLLRRLRQHGGQVQAPPGTTSSSPHAAPRTGSFSGRRRRARGRADLLRAAGDPGGGEQLRGRAGGIPADGAHVPPGRFTARSRRGAHAALHPGAGGLRDALRPRATQRLRPRARARRLQARLQPRLPQRLIPVPPGAGREVRMEDILGRPDHGAEEEEHREGFRRGPILGSSDAKKKRG